MAPSSGTLGGSLRKNERLLNVWHSLDLWLYWYVCVGLLSECRVGSGH